MINSTKTTVPAVDRGIAIIDLISQNETPLTAAEITRKLNLPRSSAHGLIAALVANGLLNKNTDQRYSLSGKVMQWANGFLAQQNVVPLFNAEIIADAELSAYSLTLTTRDYRDVVCLACHNGDSRLGFVFRMGLRLPACFAATGKAMLSTEDNATVDALFGDDWYEPMTPHSVKNKAVLLEELNEARVRGFSIDDRQVCDGMFCIGVPVFDHLDSAQYGIALSMQKAEADDRTIERIGGLLRARADRLSQRLGARF